MSFGKNPIRHVGKRATYRRKDEPQIAFQREVETVVQKVMTAKTEEPSLPKKRWWQLFLPFLR